MIADYCLTDRLLIDITKNGGFNIDSLQQPDGKPEDPLVVEIVTFFEENKELLGLDKGEVGEIGDFGEKGQPSDEVGENGLNGEDGANGENGTPGVPGSPGAKVREIMFLPIILYLQGGLNVRTCSSMLIRYKIIQFQ